jgi:hypothetical protein
MGPGGGRLGEQGLELTAPTAGAVLGHVDSEHISDIEQLLGTSPMV